VGPLLRGAGAAGAVRRGVRNLPASGPRLVAAPAALEGRLKALHARGLEGLLVRDLDGARALASEMLTIVVERLYGMPEEPGWLWIGMLLSEAERHDRAALRLLGAIEAWDGTGAAFASSRPCAAGTIRSRTG